MKIFPQALQVLEDVPAVAAKDKLVSDTIDMIDKILADLQKTGGMEACAAASRDGLLVRAIMQNEQYAESLAAMSATMLGAAEAAAAGLGLILLELEKSAEKLKELLK